MGEPRFGAVVLAAGLSSRISGFKPLLRIGDKPLLEHALDLFAAAAVDEVVTVTGHRADELAPLARSRNSLPVRNEHYRRGMFSSVQTGVAALTAGCDAFFLLPVDIPLVSSVTVFRLKAAFCEDPSHAIYYPLHQDRPGHPPLIAGRLVRPILDHDGAGGLRPLLRRYDAESRTVPVDDPFIHADIDTREDLRRLTDAYLARQILDGGMPGNGPDLAQ